MCRMWLKWLNNKRPSKCLLYTHTDNLLHTLKPTKRRIKKGKKNLEELCLSKARDKAISRYVAEAFLQ